MKKLPVGYSDFKKIIEEDYIYIDKTDYIYKLISLGKQYFLSRPRRFGKSMLVNTLENIFLGKKDLFKNLYIYDKIQFEVYPVIKISFLNVFYETPEILKESLLNRIKIIAKKYNISIDTSNYKDAFGNLIEELSNISEVVILIDEYDKPLIDYIDNVEQAEKNRMVLKSFYSTIKGLETCIKFIFITGVSKFSQTSLFSDLNNLYDITLDEEYNGICGYKEKDIKNHFQDYLTALVNEYNTSEEEFLNEMKYWYYGYSWNGKEVLYNPFSVLNLLKIKQFENHWFKSGSPSFLLKLVKLRSYNISALQNLTVESDIFDKYNIEKISLIALLFQTGYLTVKRKNKSFKGTTYTLNYPNYEVHHSLLVHIISDLSGAVNGEKGMLLMKMKTHLLKGEISEFIEQMKGLFSGLVYETQIKCEDYYSSLVYMIFSLCGIDGNFEVMTNIGRIDCSLELDKIIIIIEFKTNAPAEKAIKQIYEKKYYEKFLNKEKEIYLFGISFDTEKRNVMDYKYEKLRKIST